MDGLDGVRGPKVERVDHDERELGTLDRLQPSERRARSMVEEDESAEVSESRQPQRELDQRLCRND
jgi:hypothetical protein